MSMATRRASSTALKPQPAPLSLLEPPVSSLPAISCIGHRRLNIVNLFFTLEKEGGFDLTEQSNYEGSQENEWARLQRLAPRFSYSLSSNGEAIGKDSV